MPCELSARITPGDAKCLIHRRDYSASCRTCTDYFMEPIDMPKKKPVYADPPAPPPEISATFGQVENSNGDMEMFGATDPLLLELIDRMVMAVERRLLEDVSGMPFDVAAIHIVKAVETMARRVA